MKMVLFYRNGNNVLTEYYFGNNYSFKTSMVRLYFISSNFISVYKDNIGGPDFSHGFGLGTEWQLIFLCHDYVFN